MACMIYQKIYVGILFKWTRQLYIFILKFQTAIFGAKIVTNTWKKFTSEIEHFRAAFDIG